MQFEPVSTSSARSSRAQRRAASSSAAAAAAPAPAAPPPPPIQGAAINLGGQFSVEALLPPDGSDPAQGNSLSTTMYGNAWMVRRVAELVALYDNVLVSFFSGVEAMTRVGTLRTTGAVGTEAVRELFSRGTVHDDQFYHRMPGNVLDLQRALQKGVPLREDRVVTDKKARTSGARAGTSKKQAATGPGNYPVVGRIGAPAGGDDDDDDDLAFESASPSFISESGGGVELIELPPPGNNESSLAFASGPAQSGSAPAAAGAPLLAGGSSSSSSAGAAIPPSDSRAAAERIARGDPLYGVLPDENGVVDPAAPGVGKRPIITPPDAVGSNPVLLPSTTRVMPGGDPNNPLMATQSRKAALNLQVHYDDGSQSTVFNIEDGDVVAARRLLSGKPYSDADERIWSMIYNQGRGVTQPLQRQSTSEVQRRRDRQLSQLLDFVSEVRDRSELHWKSLPEHLRTLFLTDEARMALEHATWLAHYQQPWDPNSPLPDTTILSARKAVPAIDLMTHEMVRMPFMSLVAEVIIYWRQARAATNSRVAESLERINGIINTLKTMRISSNGFTSLLGHYDVEARRSRFQTEQRRAEYFERTGHQYSDMDRMFYSGAVAPAGRRVAALRRQYTPGISANAYALAEQHAGPNALDIAVRRDAAARQSIVSRVFGQ